MQQLIVIAGIVGLLFFIHWARKQPKQKQIQAVLILATIILIGLTLTGRLHWLFALIAGAVAAFQKLFSLYRYAPFLEKIFNLYNNADKNTGNNRNNSSANWKGNVADDSEMTTEKACSILGISKNATQEEIIEAHRRLIQKIHPDRGGNDYLASQINKAKEYLLNNK